jgi:hypothetical protein
LFQVSLDQAKPDSAPCALIGQKESYRTCPNDQYFCLDYTIVHNSPILPFTGSANGVCFFDVTSSIIDALFVPG